jgi:hypothetical protein
MSNFFDRLIGNIELNGAPFDKPNLNLKPVNQVEPIQSSLQDSLKVLRENSYPKKVEELTIEQIYFDYNNEAQ